jgi:hypothetical protein
MHSHSIVLHEKKEKQKFYFSVDEELREAFSLIEGLWRTKQQERERKRLTPSNSIGVSSSEAALESNEHTLTEKDLKTILGGSKPIQKAAGDVILQQGALSQSVYQIQK